MSIQFSIVTTEDDKQYVTVFANGKLTPPADETHPNFRAIVAACQASLAGEFIIEQDILDLFDIAAAVSRRFERLSERVTVENGEILFDGDPCQPGLSKQILRFMDEGEDFMPLVHFMEKIENNPDAHSKTQAWDWLNNHDFTLTDDGDVVAYKGVYPDGNDGFRSGHRGTAAVNDVLYENAYIPNAVGDVVTMARTSVAWDPRSACSAGLHVGTFEYARCYAQGAMLRVIVNPRDIVSVPTDAAGQKIRVCRYKVDAVIDAPETAAIYRSVEDDEGGEFYVEGALVEIGDRLLDWDGDACEVIDIDESGVEVRYDDPEYGVNGFGQDDLDGGFSWE